MTGFMHEKELSRKSFLKGGGALVVGFSMFGTGNALAATGSSRASAWPRSEERRVGKECWHVCRSRWSPYH